MNTIMNIIYRIFPQIIQMHSDSIQLTNLQDPEP